MTKKDFIIDPCSACLKKYDIKDINNINHCCYNTLAAFANSSSINDFINYPDAKVCYKCVERSKEAMGRNRCEFRLPAYPVFVQDPHYFPDLLQQTSDPKKAKEMCIDKCEDSNYKNKCVDNCHVDYFAVKPLDKKEREKEEEIINNEIDNNIRETKPDNENFKNDNIDENENDIGKEESVIEKENFEQNKLEFFEQEKKFRKKCERNFLFYLSYFLFSFIFVIFIIIFLGIMLK